MKEFSKIVCAVVALTWAHGVLAADQTTGTSPASRGIPVKPHPVKKMDRAEVEKRLTDRATQHKKRGEQARKSAQEHQRSQAPAGGR